MHDLCMALSSFLPAPTESPEQPAAHIQRPLQPRQYFLLDPGFLSIPTAVCLRVCMCVCVCASADHCLFPAPRPSAPLALYLSPSARNFCTAWRHFYQPILLCSVLPLASCSGLEVADWICPPFLDLPCLDSSFTPAKLPQLSHDKQPVCNSHAYLLTVLCLRAITKLQPFPRLSRTPLRSAGYCRSFEELALYSLPSTRSSGSDES